MGVDRRRFIGKRFPRDINKHIVGRVSNRFKHDLTFGAAFVDCVEF